MSATNYFENQILKLFFQADTIDRIAQNAGINPSTGFYISLHTSDPGEAGTQDTSETDYDDYQRVQVVRTSSGWNVVGDKVSNAEIITFPTCSGGSSSIGFWGLGLDETGPGTLLFHGALDFALAVSIGITPEFRVGEFIISVD